MFKDIPDVQYKFNKDNILTHQTLQHCALQIVFPIIQNQKLNLITKSVRFNDFADVLSFFANIKFHFHITKL